MMPKREKCDAFIDRSILFIGSTQFAAGILVLFTTAIILGVALESTLGLPQAKAIVFGSWWFIALAALIGQSLIMAMVTRYPWRKVHTGFILVHLSLVVMIISGFISIFGRIEYTIAISDESDLLSRTHMGMLFDLELVAHREANYPGTTIPMIIESDLILTDSSGIPRAYTISMNNPLEYDGWRIFHAGFDESDTPLFKVTKDPGLYLMYAGCILLFLGLLVLNISKRSTHIRPPEEVLA